MFENRKMIDWNLFKNNLKSYFNKNKASVFRSLDFLKVATKISDEYERAVKSGGDLIYKNSVGVYNKLALQTAFVTAFKKGMEAADPKKVSAIFGVGLSTGLIGFWTGAQLEYTFLPPGTTSIISNNVTFSGVFAPTIKMANSTNEDEFIDNMIDFFKNHLQTVSGVTMAVVPSTPPVPTPFLFTGYG